MPSSICPSPIRAVGVAVGVVVGLTLGAVPRAGAALVVAIAGAPAPAPDIQKGVAIGTDGDACAFTEVNLDPNNKKKDPATQHLFRIRAKIPPPELAGLLDGIGHKDAPKDPPTVKTAISESEKSSGGRDNKARAVADFTSIDGDEDGDADKADQLASATVEQSNLKTRAAAKVRDPFVINPGAYDYSPLISALSLTVEDDAGGRAVGFVGFTVESDLVPDRELWSLSVTLRGGGSPEVRFESHPLLGLDDGAVRSDLSAALDTSAPGTARLTGPYTLFRSRLSSEAAFELEQFVEAGGAAAVPEPASAVLGLAGVAVAVGYRRTRRADG